MLLKRSPPLLPLLAMLEFIRLLWVALAGDLKLLSFVAFRVFPLDFFFSSLPLSSSSASSSAYFLRCSLKRSNLYALRPSLATLRPLRLVLRIYSGRPWRAQVGMSTALI